MRCFTALVSGFLLAVVPVAAQAEPRRDEPRSVRKDLRDGFLRLDEIERKVLPTMAGMEYLGPEYDAVAKAYRLKFIRHGRFLRTEPDRGRAWNLSPPTAADIGHDRPRFRHFHRRPARR